jgi:hypothetical protein
MAAITTIFFDLGGVCLSNGWDPAAAGAPQTLASGMPSTWVATTSQGRMVGDYISTSYGSDNLAHGVFATASQPTSGTSCSSVLDNCREPMDTFVTGLSATGSVSSANDPVLFSGNGGTNAASLWNVVDNNGSKHRD